MNPATLIRSLVAAVAVVLAVAAGATPAAAHVQVLPTTAAPDDAVRWEVLVPNERESGTVALELAIPAGVIPFSYGDTPGWRRTLTENEDGSVRSIVWRGRLRPDGFASFFFLASTPAREGAIAWKSIQTYADGKKVRWIAPPDGEEPAAVTTVSKRYPRQNAGGEGTGGSSGETAAASEPSGEDEDSGSGDSDSTARWLAAAALAAAIAALAVSLLRGRRRGT
jgi:uncharacterized protein YcnI